MDVSPFQKIVNFWSYSCLAKHKQQNKHTKEDEIYTHTIRDIIPKKTNKKRRKQQKKHPKSPNIKNIYANGDPCITIKKECNKMNKHHKNKPQTNKTAIISP